MSVAGAYNAITDVEGIRVGSFTDPVHLTGVTVVLTPEGSVCGVDVRGGSPGTRETDLLSPVNRIKRVDAVALCGSSAYGLNSVGGVMRFLEERGVGHPVAEGRVVPIVPAAVIYDLCRGEGDRYVDEGAGYAACEAAAAGSVAQGNVGAGTGALSGGMKGGLGTASEVLESGVTVGALVAVNSSGTAFDPETGGFYARGLELGGEFGALRRDLPARYVPRPVRRQSQGQHTTIGVIATDAELDKPQATKVAQRAHVGLARAIDPAHTMFDGDTLFAVATGREGLPGDGSSDGKDGDRALSLIGVSAADVVARAVVHAILAAETVGSYTCYRDRFPHAMEH
ncbi:peptidase S58 family protein [Candidatus Bathyarchaeota archaeon]|nr:peptidase S58 family protein [Candidatus Bathyarchaeota archaeon]